MPKDWFDRHGLRGRDERAILKRLAQWGYSAGDDVQELAEKGLVTPGDYGSQTGTLTVEGQIKLMQLEAQRALDDLYNSVKE